MSIYFPKIANYRQMAIVLLAFLTVAGCKNQPIYLNYPFEIRLYPDTMGLFGAYDPHYAPHFVMSVRNVGLENIVIYKYQYPNSNVGFVPANNRTEFFKGSMEKPKITYETTRIAEYWGLIPKGDTIQPFQQKMYPYELSYSQIFNNSIDFVIIQIPIQSQYLDSLNLESPFNLNLIYPKKRNKYDLSVLVEKKLEHPFFVFSVQDSFNLKDVTDEFINRKIINQMK